VVAPYIGLSDHADGAGPDCRQQEVDVTVFAEQDHLGLWRGLQDPGDHRGRAGQADGGIDQHQLRAEPVHCHEHLVRHGRPPDHLVEGIAGEQRLERLVKQRL
jgi:hypothetical protein